MQITSSFALSIFLLACSSNSGSNVDAAPETAVDGATSSLDGFQRISVSQSTGTETFWIYASSPDGQGPFPVVVYAHGQGGSNVVNCEVDGVPSHIDVAPSIAIADNLAAEGYVGVSVFYRNQGSGSPAAGAFRFRDHHVFDTRSLLQAARWASETHGKGSASVAFLGHSMGTYSTFFAGTANPAWSDLQSGLDIRLVGISGMLMNHISNVYGNLFKLLSSDDDVKRSQGILGAAVAFPALHAAELGLGEIDSSSLSDGSALRQRMEGKLATTTLDLFSDLAISSAASLGLAACTSTTLSASCNSDCAASVIASAFEGHTNPVVVKDWLGQDVINAIAFWNPDNPADPASAAADSTLGLMRDLSPIYVNHTMVTPRVLPLISAGDHTLPPQGQPAVDRMLDTLVNLGVTELSQVPVLDSDGQGACEHGDYYLPARPDCGWDAITEALQVVFD